MIAEDQDRHIDRLRAELDAFEVRVRTDEVDRALQRCHGTRRVQRQQRIQMFAAVAVVVAVVSWAFALVSRTPDDQGTTQAAAPVVEWPARGDLVGNEDLTRRAKELWVANGAPSDRISVAFAGRSQNLSANLAVVALAVRTSDNQIHLAFVTSYISRGEPNLRRLLLRSTTVAVAGQPAIGFAVAAKEADDAAIHGGGALSFALAAPGVSSMEVRSSGLDAENPSQFGEESASKYVDVAVWTLLPKGVGGWNTSMVVSAGKDPIAVPMVGGPQDVVLRPVALETDGTKYSVAPMAAGGVDENDLVITAAGLVGRVIDASGRLDTGLDGIAVTTAISLIPGRLHAMPGGDLTFEQTGPGAARADLSEGNRVIITHPDRPEVLINIGRLIPAADGGWRVIRAVHPDSAVFAMTMAAR